MNSRDAAYDEAAELQRAIEASKGEKSGESTDGGTTRRGKRGRSESEEKAVVYLIKGLILTCSGNPMGPNGNEQHQPRPHRRLIASCKQSSRKRILTTALTGKRLVQRRFGALQRAIIGRRN